MGTKELKIAVLVLAAAVAGFLLGGGRILSRAYAQSEGMTSGVICVVGENYNGYAPIVVVDVADQCVVVYRYEYSSGRVKLTAARKFHFDKLLREYENDAPSVDDVQDYVSSRP